MIWILAIIILIILGLVIYNTNYTQNNNTDNVTFSDMKTYLEQHTVQMLPGRDMINANRDKKAMKNNEDKKSKTTKTNDAYFKTKEGKQEIKDLINVLNNVENSKK